MESSGCWLADDEAQAEQPAAEAANGVAVKSGSDALEAFLDSAPDPFRARPPPSTKVSSIHLTFSYEPLRLRRCERLRTPVQLHCVTDFHEP